MVVPREHTISSLHLSPFGGSCACCTLACTIMSPSIPPRPLTNLPPRDVDRTERVDLEAIGKDQ